MLEDKTVYVDLEGPSWQYNDGLGFRMRVRFRITKDHVKKFLNGQTRIGARNRLNAKRKAYYDYRTVAERLLGKRKIGWNARSFKPNDDDILIYCHELDWLAMARLMGYNFITETIVVVERLREYHA